jgi:hypothetical protein
VQEIGIWNQNTLVINVDVPKQLNSKSANGDEAFELNL